MSDASTPPMTMIVTGYNQSDLIDFAIEGALAQDYPDLQIILSDDCSTDDTHARMLTAAERYAGPHRVLVNRPASNLGTYGNIYDAFRRADGEVIIFAGGDDISYPHRTATVARRWVETGADALWSRFDVIDEAGAVTEPNFRPIATTLFLLDYFPGQKIEPLYGASTACHRSVLTRFPAPADRVRSEDTYLTLMLLANGGRIEVIEEPLLAYRKHWGAITHEPAPAANRGAIIERERRQMALSANKARTLELFEQELQRIGVEPGVARYVRDDIRMFQLKARFDEVPFLDRLRALPLARRRHELPWLIPRLAGMGPFAAFKQRVLRWRGLVG